MSQEKSLVSGFSPADSKRVDLFLQKLLPHLQEDQFLIVGGLAIRYRSNLCGIEYPIRDFNDLDLKAKEITTVLPSVTRDFMVYHYHPSVNNSFYVVLVDPKTKIKIDIFDFTIREEKFTQVPFHQWMLNVVSAEDQLVKTVFDIQRISEEKKVDPKQFTDSTLLLKIADLKLAGQIWEDRGYSQYPDSLLEAVARAEKIAQEHPQWIKKEPFRKPTPYSCPDCRSTADFPLTPMEEVYRALGYVE